MSKLVASSVASLARAPARGCARGFTLIEVLVAILVLSFGMLGVVGMQVSAMQANKAARMQSSAVRYARELAEMMRANRKVLVTGSGPYFIDSATAVPTAYPAPTATNCPASCATPQSSTPPPLHIDHSDLANYDVSDWWNRASLELPGLRALVCADAAPYDSTGKPQWSCTTPSSAAAGQSLYVKLGWPQQTTNRAADGVSNALVVTATAGIPLIVVPVVN